MTYDANHQLYLKPSLFSLLSLKTICTNINHQATKKIAMSQQLYYHTHQK
jgi:hypothetical protein